MPITIGFTISAAGYGQKVALCATDRETGKRRYMLVEGLETPDLQAWDRKLQMFAKPDARSVRNNAVLMEMRVDMEMLIRAGMGRDIDMLFSNYRAGTAKKMCVGGENVKESPEIRSTPTLAEYLEARIKRMKETDVTRNYQIYQSLYHNLLGENHKVNGKEPKRFEKPCHDSIPLADTMLGQFTNRHLMSFCEWVKRVKKGRNYHGLTTALKATLNAARTDGHVTEDLSFSFARNAPRTGSVTTVGRKAEKSGAKRMSLTPKQIDEAFAFDVRTLRRPGAGPQQEWWNRMYLDTARLMYLLMSRPADVVTMRWDMVEEKGGKKFLCYIPYKKRCYVNAHDHIVRMPICDEAMEIMERYRGRSRTGCILPFPDNDRSYDPDTPQGAMEWGKAIGRSIRKVDVFLKHVGRHLGLRWSLSLYAFRRSAITHSIEGGMGIMKVAKRAGTGLAMIDKKYYIDQGQ